MGYTSLHTHTEYSLLDGAARITDLVKRAKELGMTSLAITDHGNMFGVIKFYKECNRAGIKPILGCEVYTAERDMIDKDFQKDKKAGHLVLLAETLEGYQNIAKIVSNAYVDGFYYKPRTDKNELKKYHKGVIALSGCLAGKTQRLILEDDYEGAKKEALEMQEIFGVNNFFLELQDHNLPEDKKVIKNLLNLSKDTGIKCVCTNDSHYVKKEDAIAEEILLCIQTNAKLSDDHFKLPTEEFYLKSENEMKELFPYSPESIDNVSDIADRCNVILEFGNYHIPKFDTPEGYDTAYDYFEDICKKGFNKRYKGDISKDKKDRLKYEMKVISDMGYVEYFLIVWDFINYAKSKGIMVGPGRGSAAGSIVAYSMEITDIDPIKYNLIFERFLNPERVSMPDIDVDFCIRRRSEVVAYVTEKYGADKVSQIVTFGTLKARMAIKDVARVMGMDYAESNALVKTMPDTVATIKEALGESPSFKEKYLTDPLTKSVVDMSMKLEGIPRHTSTHAAGVVISGVPLSSYVPMMTGEKGYATQYTMGEIEELGLLKMDFLGLRNLTVIQDTLEMIKENHGEDIDLAKLPLDDENIYEMISKGKTVGVFQLESKGITDFMKKMKPNCFEDIIAGVSLYRPGPMDSIPKYIKNKKHPEKISYLTDKLAPILDVTYGCLVYQEQVMQIVRDLAGYSFARSDLVRKAMSKKKIDVMTEEKEYFIHGKLDKDGKIEIPGCIRNGISEKAAEAIYADMFDFAQYAFNKSHATAYSVVSYQTAYLKYYYPAEFMAALMSSAVTNPDHLEVFLKETKRLKIKILPPSIFKSKAKFTYEDGNVRFGLTAIKGVSDNAASFIESNQKDIEGCTNFTVMLKHIASRDLNAKAIENLIKAGAFTEMGINRATALFLYRDTIDKVQKTNRTVATGQLSLFNSIEEEESLVDKPENIPEVSDGQIYAMEKEATGTYISGHPLKKYKKEIKKYATIESEELSSLEEKERDKESVVMAGQIVSIKKHLTKSSMKEMAFVTMEDFSGEFDVVVFPKTFAKVRTYLAEGNIYAVSGSISTDRGEPSILANNIVPIGDIDTIQIVKDVKLKEFLEEPIKPTPTKKEVIEEPKQKEIKEQDKEKNKIEIAPIKIKAVSADEKKKKEILRILHKYPGNNPVYIYFVKKPVRAKVEVKKCKMLQFELEDAVGKENVKLNY